jgi:uncharacterized membrane protein YfhO
MAIIPNMRIQDNFLFHHTCDIPHDLVLHTASMIAMVLLGLSAIVLGFNLLPRRSIPFRPSGSSLTFLVVLTIAIAILLTPLTAVIWNHLPELSFLQFPWRLLAILAAILSLTMALTLSPLKLNRASTIVLTILIAAALTYPAYAVFRQPCDQEDTVQARQALFRSNQGSDPTDEYTPVTADNDSLSHANPPFWLAPGPNPGTPDEAASGATPTHLAFNLSAPQSLILNLRDYPAWHITRNGVLVTTRERRDDGLIAIPLPSGSSTISITYVHLPDQTVGDILSVLSALVLLLCFRQRSAFEQQNPQ